MLALDLTPKKILETTNNFFEDEPKLKLSNDVLQPIGTEHYMFLASLSVQLKNKTIIELGTHKGVSSYILGYGNRFYNSNNNILTYDIIKFPMPFEDTINVKYKLEDLFDPKIREENRDLLLNSDVIFIDIDPHEGILEYNMYEWLKSNKYDGIIIFDDVKLGRGHMGSTSEFSMSEFWEKIPSSEKIDLTSVGHWSGTGIIYFNNNKNNIIFD